MSKIDLTTNDIRENKTSNIQYSYPTAKIDSLNTSPNPSYSLNFYGLNQNFSASFTQNGSSTYISGVCTRATITGKSHILPNSSSINAELVLEHKKSDNTTFYVVVPVKLTNNSANPQELVPDSVFDLNKKLKKNKPILIGYKSTKNHVFVFEQPIQINSSIRISSLKPMDVFDKISQFTIKISKKKTKKTTSAFRASKGQNVQDEIECEYVTQTDTNAKPADTKMISTIMLWVFILFGVLLCLMHFFTIVSTKVQDDSANTIYSITAGIGLILLIIFIYFFTKTTTRKIQYGSMTILSIMVILMPLLAYKGFFKKQVV